MFSREIKKAFLDEKSFTLFEVIITAAVISILSLMILTVINPAELLKQSRDSRRLNDISNINGAVSAYANENPAVSLGTASTTYISIPDPTATSTTLGNACGGLGLPSLPSGWSYHCAASSTYRNTDGTGWVPINFSALSYGIPFAVLPIDPVNNASTSYYTYTAGGGWELTAIPESKKFRESAKDIDSLTFAMRTGSNLSLSPIFNSSGLVGYWKFDERSGTTATDLSGNGNTGTLTNNPTYVSSCKIGGCIGFDGTDDYISVSSTAYTFASGDFSALVWISPAALDFTYDGIMTVDCSSCDNAWKIVRDANESFFRARYSTGYFPFPAVSTNAWHYYAIVKSDTLLKLYFDGSLYSSNIIPSTHSGSPNSLWFGTYRTTPGHFFNGSLDDVRIYNRALSAAEITALYLATK